MARYQKSGKKVYDTSTGKWLTPEKSQHYADISGGWNYLPNYVAPKAQPTTTPTPTPTPTAPAGQQQTAQGAYQPTLIEITSQRPDVMTEAKKQGGDPYTAGTAANTWLNDWYNRIGKAEGADMARRGLFGTPAEAPKVEPVAPKIEPTKPAIEPTVKTTRSLIDIANSRPDVLATAKAQGGDPFTAGTPANNWLNNWWNTAGKNEFPDVILGEPIDEQTQITNEANEVMEEFFDNLPDGDDLEISDSQLLLDEILAKIESGEGVPDKPPSMAELFAETKASLGMEELETELADIDAQIDEINSELMIQAEEAGHGQQLVTTAQLGRRKGSLQREAENRIQRLNIQRGAVARMLNNKISSLNMTMSFLQQDYANATAYYKANFDKSIKMYGLIAGQEEKEQDIEDRARDEAKANWEVLYNMANEGQIDYDNLSDDNKMQIRQLELQAGFPMAMFENLKLDNPDQDIVTTTTRTDASGGVWFDVLMKDKNGEISVKSVFKGAGKVTGETGGGTQTERQLKTLETVRDQLLESIGEDGYVNTALYGQLKLENPEVFKWLPAKELLNPNDPTALKYLQTATQLTKEEKPEKIDQYLSEENMRKIAISVVDKMDKENAIGYINAGKITIKGEEVKLSPSQIETIVSFIGEVPEKKEKRSFWEDLGTVSKWLKNR